jgi:hypothetical protein
MDVPPIFNIKGELKIVSKYLSWAENKIERVKIG